MAIQIGTRPASISGCFQTWNETQVSNVIRTDMDNLTVKVRRRTTGIFRQAEASVTLKADVYDDFVKWFNVDCQQGAVPTRVMMPNGREEVWRFSEPPAIEWVQHNVFRATVKLERLPGFP